MTPSMAFISKDSTFSTRHLLPDSDNHCPIPASLTDIELSWFAAQLSDAAYMTWPVPEVLSKLKRQSQHMPQSAGKWIGVERVETNGMAALVATHTNFAMVAYRGTDEILDWIYNLDARTSPEVWHDKRFMCHKGFRRGFSEIQPAVDRVFARHVFESGSLDYVVFTGHSLGGALANLHYRHIPVRPKARLITFGAPRVFTSIGRWYYGDWSVEERLCHWNVMRWVNNNDPVPRLPPLLRGYRHHGRIMYIDAGGRTHRDASLWFRCADAAMGVFDWITGTGYPFIGDHDMLRYRQAITREVSCDEDKSCKTTRQTFLEGA